MPNSITPDSLIASAGGASDQSVQALSYVFGTPIPGIGVPGPGSAVFDGFFLIFNTALFALGVGWFAWSIMSATVHTATDGEFLGKKYSTFWFTIRGVIGFAGLVPVAHGWSLAQIFMYVMTIMGIGLANLLAGGQSGVMGNITQLPVSNRIAQTLGDQATPPMPDSIDIARNMLKTRMCVLGVNASRDDLALRSGTDLDERGRIDCQINTLQSAWTNGNIVTTYHCGARSADSIVGRDASCGGFRIETPANRTAGVNPANIAAARVGALATMESELNTLATSIINYAKDGAGTVPDIDGTIRKAAKNYEVAVARSVQAELAAATPVVRQTLNQAGGPSNGGWVSFGTAFHSYSRQITELAAALNAKVEAVSPKSPSAFGANNYYEKANTLAESSRTRDDTGSSESTASAIIAKIFGTPLTNLAIRTLASQDDSMFGPNMSTIDARGNGIVNPIVYSKELGDSLLLAGEIAAVTYIATRGAAGAAEGAAAGVSNSALGLIGAGVPAQAAAKFFSEAMKAAGPMIGLMLFALFFFGLVLSIYIPLIPFMTWWGGVIQWFVVVAEAIIAAPLWAFAHLDADGEGLGQRTQHGYIFVLNVLLRPALMVISFIVATLAVMVLGTLMVKLLQLAIPQVQANSVTGVVSFLAFIAVFMSLTVAVVHSAFGLVTLIPDQVLGWVGGHVSSTLGRDHEQHVKNSLVAISRQSLPNKPEKQNTKQNTGAGSNPINTISKGD